MSMASPNILSVDISSIDVPKRIRAVDPAHVDFFKAAIADQGFKGAITVRPSEDDPSRFELVAGAHRLEAMRQLGEAEIPADVQVMTDDQARLWEINENLVRRELNAKDRAVFLLEAKRLRQRIDGASRRGGDRRSTKVQTLDFDPSPFPLSFTDEMAARLGIKRAAILADIAFAERLAPDVLELLDGTGIADNRSALIALSQQEADRQRGIARDMRDGKFKTVGAAIASRDGRAAPGGDRDRNARAGFVTRFADAWDKLDEAGKVEALREIVEGEKQRAVFVKLARRVLGEDL